MKYNNVLDDILSQKSKVKILRYLVLSDVELNGRQIAQEIKISPMVCHTVLNEFVELGVLLSKRTGRSHLFWLNKENYLVKEIIMPLFNREGKLTEEAVSAIISDIRVPITSIILFGSVAHGTERAFSDIDLAVIIPKAGERKKIEHFFDQRNTPFIKIFGNVLSPYILTAGEFVRRYKKRAPLIIEIIEKGRVIYGKSISEVLTQ